MKPHTIIQQLEATSSRLEKEAIVKTAIDKGVREFFIGAQYALNALITFGVKKVPIHSGPDGQGLPWAAFQQLATSLEKRELTGHDARDAIELAMSVATVDQWNDWYRRILIKDLRCGVSETTINKVAKDYPQFQVPVFTCQLAHDGANHESKIKGNKLIDIKLDGVRVLTIVYPDGRVNQYSRNGKELSNFEHVKTQFSAVASTLTEPYVFDGEIMSSSFQDLMTQIHRKSNVKANDATLYLFDWLPLSAFNEGIYKVPQKQRRDDLAAWFEKHGLFLQLLNVNLVSYRELDLDTDAGKAEFKQINQDAIAGGYEGIMIKDPNAPYELKRSVAWLKQKPFIEVSLTAISVEEGTGKNAGRMGAILFEGEDDGKTITVSVGSGWSDADRDAIWKIRDQVPGEIAEIRADAITQNQDGTYSLRFPRFKIWRGFVKGEKL